MAEQGCVRHVGRIVFGPDSWVLQTLDSHARNTALLAEAWDARAAFPGPIPDLSVTRARLIEAARAHDTGKPACFRLTYAQSPSGGRHFDYSFSGHPYHAFHSDPYVQTLVRLHHQYSVDAITEHVARLRLEPETQPLAGNLPLDLYALEMCDQIEATVACAVLGARDPEARVFMDFQLRAVSDRRFEVDPYPFGQTAVTIELGFVELAPSRAHVTAVEKARSEVDRRSAVRELEAWLLREFRGILPQRREVELCPWRT